MLCGDLKQSRGVAKREVKLAGQLADVPATAEALADGAITPQHARLIAEAAEAAPPGAPIDDAELLDAAANQAADLFRRTVRGHLDERAGQGLEERRRRQRQRRAVSWKHEPDGMFKLFGTFDPLAGARIETALTATGNRLWHREDPKNRATAKQRLADALELLLTGGGTGTNNGNGNGTANGSGSANASGNGHGSEYASGNGVGIGNPGANASGSECAGGTATAAAAKTAAETPATVAEEAPAATATSLATVSPRPRSRSLPRAWTCW